MKVEEERQTKRGERKTKENLQAQFVGQGTEGVITNGCESWTQSEILCSQTISNSLTQL